MKLEITLVSPLKAPSKPVIMPKRQERGRLREKEGGGRGIREENRTRGIEGEREEDREK
jgi:hypothetical protein